MKILYITTVGSTMGFFKSLINQLIEQGHLVEIATNELGGEAAVPDCYRDWGCVIHPLSCTRSPFNPGNAKTISEIENLVSAKKYDIVHCHTPIAAACTRVACRKWRKKGLKVAYTAHGFHFFKGAPLKSWAIYYPVEKALAKYTDALVTINHEDYNLALRKLHAEEVVYVPGVGIDTRKFAHRDDKDNLRKKLMFPESVKVMVSVGELSVRKNHEVIVKAMTQLDDMYHYYIVGKGSEWDRLEDLSKQLHVDERVHFLGRREDIPDILGAADLFLFPSKQEGLPVALMEAVASGTPCIASNIRGNSDILECWLSPTDVNGWAKAIREGGIIGNIEGFEIETVNMRMMEIYGKLVQ